MKVEHVDGPLAEVTSGGVRATVNIRLVSSVKKGDYVLIHAGVAIEKLHEDRAQELLSLFEELDQAME